MTSLFQAEADFEELNNRRSHRSRRMKRKLKASAHSDLNIVSMIDIFAVLVFFLLVGSSISVTKLSTLNLTIPLGSNTPVAATDNFQLTVSLFEDRVLIAQGETKSRFSHVNGQVDAASLTELLVSFKASYPTEERVTLLVEDSVPYEQIIRVMDSIRMYPSEGVAETEAPLFPAISMGDIATQNLDNDGMGRK